jgi:hypothetical protein
MITTRMCFQYFILSLTTHISLVRRPLIQWFAFDNCVGTYNKVRLHELADKFLITAYLPVNVRKNDVWVILSSESYVE